MLFQLFVAIELNTHTHTTFTKYPDQICYFSIIFRPLLYLEPTHELCDIHRYLDIS